MLKDVAADSGGGDIRFSKMLGHPALAVVAARFRKAGIPLYPVGGCVRDVLADLDAYDDIDCTTPADADTIERVLAGVGTLNAVGKEYGTIMAHIKVGPAPEYGIPDNCHYTIEVTQFRSEEYQPGSRKPSVGAASSLEDDLIRRDFTVNAMAVSSDGELIDPFGGETDLAAGVIRTPGDADAAFNDDPLRIARAARFAATRGFTVDEETEAAAIRVSGQPSRTGGLNIVSGERFHKELDKVMSSDRAGALNDVAMWSRRLGCRNHMFGSLDSEAVERLPDPVDRDGRLALLAAVSGDDAEDSLKAIHYPNDEARMAGHAGRIARSATAGMSVDDARRVVLDVKGDNRTLRAARHAAVALGADTSTLDEAVNDPRLRGPMPVDGNDVMQRFGLKGKDVGAALARVRDAFVANPSLTAAEAEEAVRSGL